MRHLSEVTRNVTDKNFKNKYIALGRIVNHWPDIAGKQFADKAWPVKLRYFKSKKNDKPDVTLEIAASTADATVLHYQKDLILERINQIFGDRWIKSIRFVAIPSNESVKKQRFQPKKATRPLTGSQKNTLSEMLGSVADEEILSKLQNLGQAILMKE